MRLQPPNHRLLLAGAAFFFVSLWWIATANAQCKDDPANHFVCKGSEAPATGYIFPPKLANQCRKITLIPQLEKDRDLFKDQRDRCLEDRKTLKLKLEETWARAESLEAEIEVLQEKVSSLRKYLLIASSVAGASLLLLAGGTALVILF